MVSVCFQGKPFSIIVIQVYAPATNGEETEVEWFCEDLQDLLELTPKIDVLFIIGDRNAKGGSQEIPGVTGKCGIGVQNKAEQSLTELVIGHIKHPLPRIQKMALHMDITKWSIPKSD